MNRVLNEYFAVIEDYRCQCDVKHRLTDILTLVMCAVLCGIDELSEIVDYGAEKAGFLKEAFGIESIPSYSTLTRVMNMVDAEKLSACIVNIMREALGIAGNIIAMDGKTIRSTQRPSAKSKLHIVTAYLTENGVSLGQLATGEKTNEIPVVRELIGMLDIKGKTLTLDAMHCQKETAQLIVSGGGDYVFGLKGNQKLLHNDVALYMNDCMKIKDILVEAASTSEKNRNRFEERTCCKAPDISWIHGRDEWAGLKNIYSIRRKTIVSGKKSEETEYYLTSLNVPCEEMLHIVREHWKIESMHWMLDVVFSEDECRILSTSGQKSMNIFRKAALALHQKYISELPQKTKPSVKKNMFRSLMNDKLLCNVVSMDV